MRTLIFATARGMAVVRNSNWLSSMSRMWNRNAEIVSCRATVNACTSQIRLTQDSISKIFRATSSIFSGFNLPASRSKSVALAVTTRWGNTKLARGNVPNPLT